MAIKIVFETHSLTEDNAAGVATGWLPGRLSPAGRDLAVSLGERRRNDGLAAVFTSDLERATETARIAFDGSTLPILADWRLRECDYGSLNGAPVDVVVDRRAEYLDHPYPEGESWRQAVNRVGRFVEDLPLRWAGARILVIGHVATRWGLDCLLGGWDLGELVQADFAWQEGWEYQFD
jgi:broad specificity phosphatase PhoE